MQQTSGDVTKPGTGARWKAGFAYLVAWLSGVIVLLASGREDKFERWHALQAIAFGVVLTLFMVPATMASFGLLGPPPDALGLVLSLLGLVLTVTWLALMAFAVLGKRARLPGAAQLADRFA